MLKLTHIKRKKLISMNKKCKKFNKNYERDVEKCVIIYKKYKKNRWKSSKSKWKFDEKE